MPASEPTHDAWMDAFFASDHRHQPVNATFIGVHEHDDRLPDLSDAGVGDALADLRALRAGLEAVPMPVDSAGRVDRRLARGFLEIREWELASDHFHRGNPSLYTGEAIFGVIGLLLTDFAPLADRVEAATGRMDAIPAFLRQARATVRRAPAAWTERALRECDGALALFGRGLPGLVATGGDGAAGGSAGPERGGGVAPRWEAFERACARAASAFEEHRASLGADLLAAPRDRVAAGEEALDMLLRHAHALESSADEIAEDAEAELWRAAAAVEARSRALGFASPAAALAGLRDHHPSAAGYYDAYGSCWRAMKRVALDRELVTWPDFPIRYVPRPEWVREAAPYLYFLFYRSPAVFRRPAVHEYLVAPLPEGDPSEFLHAHDDSVIKLNHVVHHGGLGHHVQNWNAFRAASRVGRVAAVDCASRIAMLCGGTMAEGWACYATGLMAEVGALTPLEELSEHHARVRMAARAVVDVRLHQGRMSLDDAAAFYRSRAGMSEGTARGEAVKNSMFPGGALMYLTGTDGIRRLRAEVSRREGGRFDLRAFHDELLSWGSIPVALVAEQMTNTDNDAE